MKRIYIIPVLVFTGVMLNSCGNETPTEPTTPSPVYNFSIAAHIFPGASVVMVLDSSGTEIDTSRAEVYINGNPLIYMYGRFVSYAVSYSPGETYSLEVIVDSDTITASVTAPPLDSLRITEPAESTSFSPGIEIPVSWTYYGDIGNGKAYVEMDYDVPDTITYMSGPIDGAITTHNIPSEATSTPGEARIIVMGGSFTTIPGLLDPDPRDGIDGSYLTAYTLDEVNITITDGE